MKLLRLFSSIALVLAALPAAAQDFNWSAFGTLGYARSNRDYHYLRSIDADGTLRTDSLLGAQGDLRFTPQWSATVQLRVAQSVSSDTRWDLTPTWAFLAWRPGDDWLLRAGKMRLPIFLYSESMDVGTTHDMARLPAETYRQLSSSDFIGLSVAKTWALGPRDLTLDLFSGSVPTTSRFWQRDGAPPVSEPGANFLKIKVASTGAILTLRGPDSTVKGGVVKTRQELADGRPIPSRYEFVQISPGVGYYQVDNSLPGPGVPSTQAIHNTIFMLGVDQVLWPGWRVAAEYTRNQQYDTDLGFDSRGGYVALFHTLGRFTPYASYGRLKSSESTIAWAERLTGNRLPAFIPGADAINAAQRAAGETSFAVDQSSVALGSSYTIDAHQKIKAEWLHTRIGRVSRFVDTPPGSETPRNTSIDTFSLGYSFSF